MRARACTASVIMVALALSGCLGGNDAGPTDEGSPKTSDMGAIEGRVINDEKLPVEGAAIGIRSGDTTRSAVSGPDGNFSFAEVTPGTWDVSIQAAFYAGVVRRIDVGVGQVAEIEIELAPIPNTAMDELFIQQSQVSGFINLAYSFPWTSGATLGGSPVQDLPNEASHFPLEYDPSLRLQEVLLELVWEPATGVTGTRLQIAVCDEPTVKDTYHNCFNIPDSPVWSNRTEGESPLEMRLTDLPLKEIKEYRIAIGDGGGDRPPVTFQQSFELFISVCYGQTCPSGYQMRPAE